MRRVDIFLDDVPDYTIADGVMYVSVENEWCLGMPVRKFEMGMARAAKVVAEYHARQAEVVPFRRGKRGRGHAASP